MTGYEKYGNGANQGFNDLIDKFNESKNSGEEDSKFNPDDNSDYGIYNKDREKYGGIPEEEMPSSPVSDTA